MKDLTVISEGIESELSERDRYGQRESGHRLVSVQTTKLLRNFGASEGVLRLYMIIFLTENITFFYSMLYWLYLR